MLQAKYNKLKRKVCYRLCLHFSFAGNKLISYNIIPLSVTRLHSLSESG